MATTNIAADIQNITGVGTADAQFLISAQKFVVSSVPKNLLKWAATATVPGNHGGNTSDGVKITVPIGTDSILDVSRNGFSGTEVPYGMKGFIANTASLYLATNTYPKYYLDDANPGEGVRIIVKPIPTDDETAIALYVDHTKIDDDSDLRNAVIFHASSKEFTQLATDGVPSWTSPSLPVAPSLGAAPTISDLSISVVQPNVPSISTVTFSSTDSDIDASAPVFTTATISAGGVFGSSSSPGYVKPTLTTRVSFEDFWEAEEDSNPFGDNDPGELSLTSVSPSVPSLTSVVFTSIDTSLDVVKPVISTATVAASSVYTGSAPAYTKPAVALGSTPTISDLTISSVAPVVPSSPSFSAPTISPITVASTTVSNLGIPPTYTAPVVGGATEELTSSLTGLTGDALATDADFLDISKWFTAAGEMIEDEEDIELAQVQLQKISSYIQAYLGAMQNQLNIFNDDNAEYQSKLQEGIQQSQINAQKAQSQAQIDATDAQQEASLKLQKENQEYAVSLQRFSSEVQEYQVNVDKEVQEYQQNLAGDIQVWQAERQTDLQKYASDIQNEINEFNKENIAYQSAIQESMQEIQVANQVNLAQAQSDLQAATTDEDRDLQRQLQNNSNDMQAIIQDNNRKVDLYQSEAAIYQANIGKEIQEYTQKLSKYQLEMNTAYQAWQKTESDSISVFQVDVQNELNDFNKNNVLFQANIQEAMQEIQVANQVNIAAGQASLQVAIDNENRSQQRQLQNGVNDMQAIVQNNDDLITKYSAELQQYQLKVAAEVQEYQQNLEGDLRVWESERSTDLQEYNANLQKYQSEVAEKAQESTVKTQNVQYYEKQSEKYYSWARAEVTQYVQNNSKMINRTIAAQAAQQQQQYRR